jgi:hypothetical protein
MFGKGPATFVGWILVMLLAAPPQLLAQSRVDVWRGFAQKLEPGRLLKIRMIGGPRFTATLLQVSDDGMMVQPKTRAAVPPQEVRFDRIETLEVDHSKGIGIGKAVAIGAAVGAGAWLALMALAFAVWGD